MGDGVPTVTNAGYPRHTARSHWSAISPGPTGEPSQGKRPCRTTHDGIIDVAMALEGTRGDIKYWQQGNMTKEEMDKTISAMMEDQEGRPLPLLLDQVDQRLNLWPRGRGGIQVRWRRPSPACAAVESMQHSSR